MDKKIEEILTKIFGQTVFEGSGGSDMPTVGQTIVLNKEQIFKGVTAISDFISAHYISRAEVKNDFVRKDEVELEINNAIREYYKLPNNIAPNVYSKLANFIAQALCAKGKELIR